MAHVLVILLEWENTLRREEIIFFHSSIHLFTHSFHSFILSTYFIPGSVPEVTQNIEMSAIHPLISKGLNSGEG